MKLNHILILIVIVWVLFVLIIAVASYAAPMPAWMSPRLVASQGLLGPPVFSEIGPGEHVPGCRTGLFSACWCVTQRHPEFDRPLDWPDTFPSGGPYEYDDDPLDPYGILSGWADWRPTF